MSEVRCSFEVRRTDDSGKEIITSLPVDGPRGDGELRTDHPPVIGDTIYLTDKEIGGYTYRVVARDWEYPAYGSKDWPAGEPRPLTSPLLRCLIERVPDIGKEEQPYMP
ncbi:hypothetical protein [Nocardia farcinica]|uniref:hypothetical protein n=1 Tax=Nocardia farcinica TaxID=37329 RepID=UPI00189404CF|nr:hypothetical protein [Nocardia farcinica]MBF6577253.1 hypothetical protein [Nocardia farcinica]